MGFDWKGLVKTVAPALGTALGGPLGGMAARSVAGAVLGNEDASEKQIAEALAAASPDVLLKLKEADQQFAVRLRELDIDLEKIAAADRDSARNRQVQSGDKTPQHLAYIYTLGLFAMLIALAVAGDEIPDEVMPLLQTAAGVLFAMVYASKDYFFGSSAGSKQKTDLMGQVRQ